MIATIKPGARVAVERIFAEDETLGRASTVDASTLRAATSAIDMSKEGEDDDG